MNDFNLLLPFVLRLGLLRSQLPKSTRGKFSGGLAPLILVENNAAVFLDEEALREGAPEGVEGVLVAIRYTVSDKGTTRRCANTYSRIVVVFILEDTANATSNFRTIVYIIDSVLQLLSSEE